MIRTNIKANSGSIGDSTSCNPSESLSNSSKVLSKRQRRLQTARDISLLLKQQWRPGLFALFLLITDMIYWLFYFVEAKKLETVSPTTSWFVEWTQCLAQQAAISIKIGTLSLTTVPTVEQLKMAGDAAQAACASIARPYVPSFSWAALSDIMPATFGITVLAIFGTKLELWQDLKLRLSGGRDTTVFLMGDITKETKDRHQHQQKQQQEQQGQSKKVQQTDMKQDDGFYSQDLEMDQTDYNSHDILTSLPEAAAAPAGHYRNNLTRSGSQTAAATPLSPTSHVSFTDTKVGYGGPTRKASTRTEDNRENIYYRNPVHGGSPHQQRAKLVSEGSEPWPSWPSTTAVVTSITYHGRPPLTIETHDQGSHGQSRSSVYAPTSATSQAVSPSSRGFYNSDDLSQASPSIYPDQRSGHEQQQQQQFSWSQNQSPTTRTLSPPPVPQKSGRRRI
ncbi:hypothetical protein BGZ54_001680 [Gamsiella multidivaricata]|nr:hypothetical protein BGZ54_001680 [Gamsiella multidivaricata]